MPGPALGVCAVILRLHQVNQPSFPSLISYLSNWLAQGTVVTLWPGWTGVEVGVGTPSCPPLPSPRPRGRRYTCSQRARPKPAASTLLALCLIVPEPNFTFCTTRPAGPPAPGLSPLPSLLFLCFSSVHFSLGLLLYPAKTIKGKDLESKLEG